jgi:hypothetical protein
LAILYCRPPRCAGLSWERRCAPVLLQQTASGPLVDFEGTELTDLEQARAEAIADARALMSTAMIDGHTIFGRSIEIRTSNFV